MISNIIPSSSLILLTPVLAFVCLQLITFLKRIFSPLAPLPGPWITRVSYIPIFAYDQRSKRTEWIRQLHEEYGPVVRVSPSEVSVSSATGIRDIFSGSPTSGGPFPKSKFFELFKHFGARNAFTSITSAQHGWRRKIIGSSYTQSAVLAREAATGNIWRVVGNYLNYIDQNGIPTQDDDNARSLDIHTANTFFAADGVSSYVLLNGMDALAGNEKHRRLIIATQEKPEDMLSYLHQEYREFFNWLRMIKSTIRSLVPGLGPQVISERTRVGDKDPKKINSPWIGGTEYRDFGYRSYLESRRALESNPQGWNSAPITVKLAWNVLTGDEAAKGKKIIVEDPGMRGFEGDSNFLKDAGAASETMDHLIAGQDTTSETLSHAFQALCVNKVVQEKLRSEVASLHLPLDHGDALSSEQLSKVMKLPYLEAIIKETLRLYPPHTTNIHRMVPAEGRLLDGFYLPGGVKVGTSSYVVHMNSEVFGAEVQTWRPERWLIEDANQIRKMDHTLWAFGSGARGCVGKHLAMVEMKLLLSAIYTRYTTIADNANSVPLEQNHYRSRTTNRDYQYFPKASGRIAFVKSVRA
ncbi:uncharacterized protein Z518_01988 [Rhinocladiella mackenziei CBS 650.93]|uniref:Uncharacterized protein n=1 Tax=Rhinocladiella mackenziei CBS 650.93 TaxID=1442369 RepID=A0A0D2JDP9_9EURO|nr:uncharacterized protein Z518_01988 [Rhinocladiella mackenziei CBS 650.93]KIX07335.1 hypothetical protein Z518_01988 [Rhinocladiella mackenziei CBS 650.93]